MKGVEEVEVDHVTEGEVEEVEAEQGPQGAHH